jgi:hypothetical protein
MTDQPRAAGAHDADRIGQQELDRLAHSITERFAPHLHAAAEAVREAEKGLSDAQAALASAEQEAANRAYHSDPLVFMRATVSEDLEALERKSTPKKVRASFRYLLSRAVELAEGEVSGYHRDLDAARRERTEGVDACRQAEQVAQSELEAARAMHQRVLDAERAARDGLDMLRAKA